MTRKIIGIDIRNDNITALQVQSSLKGILVEHIKSSPVALLSENDTPENKLSAAIGKAIEGLDLTGTEFVVSIPPDLISIRNLRVPFKDKKRINQVLPFEIEPMLPFPVEEVTIDFQIVRQQDQADIIACAIKTKDLMAITDILKKYSIDPQVVTIGSSPAALCLTKFSDFPEQFIFIELDQTTCSIIAVASGRIHLGRTFLLRTSDSLSKTQTISHHLTQFLAAFESFYNFTFNPSVIYVSGSGIDLNVFICEIDQVMNISVKPIDMLNDVLRTTHLAEGIALSPSQSAGALSLVAAEVAGIDMINFYGERSIFKRYWEENKNNIIKTGALASFVLIIFMFNILLEARYLDKSIRLLNQQITLIFQSTFPDVAKIIDPVQQMRTMIQEAKGKSSYAGLIEDVKPNVDIFNEISQLVPDSIDVEFTQFVRGEENVLVSGDTNTFNAVDEIKGQLEKSKYFTNITITSANMDAASNRVQFKLKMDL